MKYFGRDFAVGSIPNYVQDMEEQTTWNALICADSNSRGVPQRPDPDCGGQTKCDVLSYKCDKKVLRWKRTSPKMGTRQQCGLFRPYSSLVIGILLGLMCCGSLHAKGKTGSKIKH